MAASRLSQLEREITRILHRLRGLQEISVPSAAKLLKKSPQYIRDNLPVIYHGPKSHHIRLVDVEAYQERLTYSPKNNHAED